MATTNESTVRVQGYVSQRNGRTIETEKAVRVTLETFDGEAVALDTTWIPRSVCEDLRIKRVQDADGVSFEFSARVAAWWCRKQDTRPGWQRRGERFAPMATRPY